MDQNNITDGYELREIFDTLRNLPKNDLFKIIYGLLKGEVIDFVELSNVYVTYLKDNENLAKAMKAEASMNIMSFLLDPKKVGIADFDDIRKNRSLYFLDKSGVLNVDELKTSLDYDPEKGRELSKFHWGEDAADYGK